MVWQIQNLNFASVKTQNYPTAHSVGFYIGRLAAETNFIGRTAAEARILGIMAAGRSLNAIVRIGYDVQSIAFAPDDDRWRVFVSCLEAARVTVKEVTVTSVRQDEEEAESFKRE